jgi:hypothetical protein
MMGSIFSDFPQALVQEGKWVELIEFAQTHKEEFRLSRIGETKVHFRYRFRVDGDTMTIFHLRELYTAPVEVLDKLCTLLFGLLWVLSSRLIDYLPIVTAMKSLVSEEVIGTIIREDITRSHHYLGQFTRVGQEVDEPVSPLHLLLNGNFEYPADVCVRVVLRILGYCPSAAIRLCYCCFGSPNADYCPILIESNADDSYDCVQVLAKNGCATHELFKIIIDARELLGFTPTGGA